MEMIAMSDDKKYIYESPDGGITVTRREFGTLNKEDYYGVPEFPDDDGYIIATDSAYSIDVSSINISDLTFTPNIYQSNIKVVDADGKEYSFRQMFDRLEAIEKRLTILVPDDKLLEQYKILQELYDQYKAAESLLYGPTIED